MEDAAGVTLVKEIAKFKPHTIICTHFLPAQLVASIKKASKVLQNEIRLGLVITDLDLQSMWVQPGAVDVYYLPRNDSAVVLRDYERRAEEKRKKAGKVQSKVQSKVVVSGIPIAPRFADAVEKKTKGDLDAGFEMFNLKRADPRPVVVIMSGGVGIEEVYKLCLKAKRGCQFVVVMGRQADVREVLTAVEVPSRHSVEVRTKRGAKRTRSEQGAKRTRSEATSFYFAHRFYFAPPFVFATNIRLASLAATARRLLQGDAYAALHC